jgi:hypothetical protein
MDISQPALMRFLGMADRNIVQRAIEQHRISWTVDDKRQRRIRRLVFGLAKAVAGHDSGQSVRVDALLYARASNDDDARMLVECGAMKPQCSAADAR